MTGRRTAARPGGRPRQNVSFRASPQTGVGISIGFPIIRRHTAPSGPYGGTDSPHPSVRTGAPPSQVRGARPRTASARVPWIDTEQVRAETITQIQRTTFRQHPQRTIKRYRAEQGRNDYANPAHDLPAAPAMYNKTIPSGSGKKRLRISCARPKKMKKILYFWANLW